MTYWSSLAALPRITPKIDKIGQIYFAKNSNLTKTARKTPWWHHFEGNSEQHICTLETLGFLWFGGLWHENQLTIRISAADLQAADCMKYTSKYYPTKIPPYCNHSHSHQSVYKTTSTRGFKNTAQLKVLVTSKNWESFFEQPGESHLSHVLHWKNFTQPK